MSIRLRLTLYWAVLLTSILVLSGAAVYLLFARSQWAQLDGALMEEADSAASNIRHSGFGSARDIVRQLSEERDLGPARRVILIVAGHVIAEAGASQADLPARLGDPRLGKIADGRNHIFRYGLTSFTLGGASALLADGVDATPVRLAITRLRRQLLLIIPIILAVSIAGGYWLAGRALAPMHDLIAGLTKIQPSELRRRLPIASVEDEVAQLTRAINALLERVARAVDTERRFATDAAHEMRTPLAILRTGLEVTLARDRSGREYHEALHAALDETVSLCRTADELLVLARLDHESAMEREMINLRILAEEVIEAVEPLIQAKQIALRASIENDPIIAGNRNHLQRLIINLLDNALKFTPVHGRVGLEVSRQNGNAILRIENDGPAIPDDDLPHLFERFFRGKSSITSGSGLGLSLCQEIVRLHDGVIRAANLATGGVEFVITMPALDCTLSKATV